ncbi:MAG: hypothetical protein VB034_01090 [Eubacteriales bacterium]|nr:hypothetical protein [Eubacteriales bacterium]
MAIRDFVEYVKEGRALRVIDPEGQGGELLYRVVNLSLADDPRQPYQPFGGEIVAMKDCCVVELTDGRERLLVGPQRPDVRIAPHFSETKPVFSLNRDAPPIHLSRLWLQNESNGTRFFLGCGPLVPRISWRFDRGEDRFRFCMDEYCRAYYEGGLRS